MSPARVCAFTVVRRVFEQAAYADRAFPAEAKRLDPRDRGLAMQIAYGTVQRRATLDHFAVRLAGRPLSKLEPAVVAALRIGLFQLLYLGGVADHAAVNESVELVKAISPRGAGLVNAVLRRTADMRADLLGELDDATPATAAVMHSVPAWLADMWWDELGGEEARRLLRAINEPAESALRVNTLASSVEDVLDDLAVPARAAPDPCAPDGRTIPEGLVIDASFDAQGSALWRDGKLMPQSRGSMAVSRELGPGPGDRVLDLCAAPGAKTTHIAALMEDRGLVTAVELHAGRAGALERTCARMRVTCARVEVGDAGAFLADTEFDRVLVDPPCTGLGTLQSRPDVRWRATPEAIGDLSSLQLRILAAGAAALRPGGVLVYSVCTTSRAESEEVIERFLSGHREFRAERSFQLLPHRHGTDGFYLARLRHHGRQ